MAEYEEEENKSLDQVFNELNLCKDMVLQERESSIKTNNRKLSIKTREIQRRN